MNETPFSRRDWLKSADAFDRSEYWFSMNQWTLMLILIVQTVVPLKKCCPREPLVAAIEVGDQKQLLLDDYLLESQENVQRVLHQPRRFTGNPIIVGDRSWEKWTAYPNGRPVIFDQQMGKFRMWYMASLLDEEAYAGILYKACYAESKDGYRWTKPNLGLVEWDGSRRNNIMPWGETWMRRVNVIKDPRDTDPNRRYKMTYVDVFDGRSAITKAYSNDGIHWRLNGDEQPWFRKPHNGNLMGWDPRIQRYVFFVRMPGGPNSVGRSTSPDLLSWSAPETVLAPGPHERRKHFKGLAAFMYEGIYLGWLWVFERGKEGWIGADAELAFSRDGTGWTRLFPGAPFFERGKPGAWDSHLSIPVAPVVRGDKLWIYYWGENFPYGVTALRKVQDGWVESGQRRQRATGVATLQVDRFVSLDAGDQGGYVITKPLKLHGKQLIFNVSCKDNGNASVEMLDGSGGMLGTSHPLTGDGVLGRMMLT